MRTGDLDRSREFDSRDVVDYVNALEFRGHDGIAPSVAMYQAIFASRSSTG